MKRIDAAAWKYLFAVLFIYVFMCAVMGHIEWTAAVFIKNTAADLSGETPRMLAAKYYGAIMNIAQPTEFDAAFQPFANTIRAVLPQVIEFSCIEAVVLKSVKNKNFKTKAVLLLAGCILQALIAVSWAEPITWEIFEEHMLGTLAAFMMRAWLICSLIYVVYKMLIENECSIDMILNYLVSIPMSLVYEIIFEAVKIIFVVFLFYITSFAVSKAALNINISALTNIIMLLLSVYYVLLNHILNSGADFLTGLFMKTAVKGQHAERTRTGEVFCALAAVSMMLCCFVLYFRLK